MSSNSHSTNSEQAASPNSNRNSGTVSALRAAAAYSGDISERTVENNSDKSGSITPTYQSAARRASTANRRGSVRSNGSNKKGSESVHHYLFEICLKRGTVIGGGLPNNAYAEVFVDGELLATTDPVPSQPVWNLETYKRLEKLEPSTPIIVSFSLYKKRWTSSGFKLVGSVHFPLSDYFEHIDKGPVEKELVLHSNRRNLTLYGSLIVTLNLRQVEGSVSDAESPSRRKRVKGDDAALKKKSPMLLRMLGSLEGATIGTNYFQTDDDAESNDTNSVGEDDAVGQVMAAWRRAQRFDNESLGYVIVFGVFAVWLYSIGVNLLAFLSVTFWLQGAQQRVDALADKLRWVTGTLYPH